MFDVTALTNFTRKKIKLKQLADKLIFVSLSLHVVLSILFHHGAHREREHHVQELKLIILSSCPGISGIYLMFQLTFFNAKGSLKGLNHLYFHCPILSSFGH